jgi:prophage regulatory protein
MKQQAPQSAPRLGAQPEVSKIAGIEKSEIWRRVKAGTFPAPVRLGTRCTRWNLVEVEEWARQRLAERDQKAAA